MSNQYGTGSVTRTNIVTSGTVRESNEPTPFYQEHPMTFMLALSLGPFIVVLCIWLIVARNSLKKGLSALKGLEDLRDRHQLIYRILYFLIVTTGFYVAIFNWFILDGSMQSMARGVGCGIFPFNRHISSRVLRVSWYQKMISGK